MKSGLDHSLGFLLGIAYRKVTNLLSQHLKEYNITPEQWAVLYRISEQDGMIQKEIGERAGKDKPTTTRLLISLEEKGFIRKAAGEDDRRSYRIYATEAGRELVRKVEPIERQTMKEAGEGIAEKDMESLIDMIKLIITNVDQEQR